MPSLRAVEGTSEDIVENFDNGSQVNFGGQQEHSANDAVRITEVIIHESSDEDLSSYGEANVIDAVQNNGALLMRSKKSCDCL